MSCSKLAKEYMCQEAHFKQLLYKKHIRMQMIKRWHNKGKWGGDGGH